MDVVAFLVALAALALWFGLFFDMRMNDRTTLGMLDVQRILWRRLRALEERLAEPKNDQYFFVEDGYDAGHLFGPTLN